MKYVKKKLEMLLEKLEKPSLLDPSKEQYVTPSSIASDMLWYAYQKGDIKDKKVVDFGCGNGILAIGSALLGAKETIGIDIDEEMIKLAERNAKKMNVRARFLKMDVQQFNEKCDVVIMNPPFGAQFANRGADKKFLEKAMETAGIVYSLHLKEGIEFIRKIVEKNNFSFSVIREYKFPIKASMPFHRRKIAYFDVALINARIKFAMQ